MHAGSFVGAYVLKDAEEFYGTPLRVTLCLSHCSNDPLLAVRGGLQTKLEGVTLSGSDGSRHKPDQHSLVVGVIGGDDAREVWSDRTRFETVYPINFV
jgi:hypothetical protein